jgi:hypothetical protein
MDRRRFLRSLIAAPLAARVLWRATPTISPRYIYGRVRIDLQTIHGSNEGAFLRALHAEMKAMEQDIRRATLRQLRREAA